MVSTEHDAALSRFNATWAQIATALRNEPAQLVFESVDEPQFDNADNARKAELLNELNRSFHKVTTVLWDNGSFYDRGRLRWKDAGLFGQIRSSWTTRSATASSDDVFVPASGPVKDRTLTRLAGNRAYGVRATLQAEFSRGDRLATMKAEYADGSSAGRTS
ncbi:hypothetical protein [Streptomyces sp. NPDC002463]|uniref:hypothetical protein n=1 Tax=Streptomyces sp. NPDC002463 TaxID=3364645 RepID=UPI00369801AE